MVLVTHRHVKLAVESIFGCLQPPASLDLQHLTYGGPLKAYIYYSFIFFQIALHHISNLEGNVGISRSPTLA